MFEADVIVIGGGPGGSTAATALARKGYRVLLLEREHFPRDHVGESLLPSSMPFLEWLGVLPAIQDAGFLEKWGATMLWGKEQTPWSWYFRETNRRYPHTYQVWRPRFDQILLENARTHGVDVREGHRVTEVLFEDGRAIGVRYVSDPHREDTARAGFVVDASGQGAVVGHALGLRRWDDFFQNLAVYAYFEGCERLPAPDQNNLFIESYRDGWLWSIPLNSGWMSVGAVVDQAHGQKGVRLGLKRFLKDQIRRSRYTALMLRDAKLVRGPFVVKDWSYMSSEVVGEGYILVGDAACFIDPLFSSGIHLAMMSGALAAAYVTTCFKDEAMKAPAAIFYKDQYRQEYGQFREMAKLFYSTNRTVDSYFWEARRILGHQVGSELTPRQAFIRAIAGRPPRGYERVVLESGTLPSDFEQGVASLELERSQRKSTAEALLRFNLLDSAPRLASGVRLQKQPEVRDGEIVWGYALSRAGERLGEPCDPLTANILSLIDGKRAMEAVLDEVVLRSRGVDPAGLRQLALQLLVERYADGTIDV